MFTGTAVFSACKRTSELHSVLGRFTAVMIHTTPFFADRNTILADGKVIFVFGFDTAFFIQINERHDVLPFTVFIDGHGIMGRIQKQFCNIEIGKKGFKKPWESCFEAGFNKGKMGRSLSEPDATSIYKSYP